jgi:hypothetical protein
MKKQHTLPTSNRDLWKAGVLLLTLLTSGCTTPEPPALPPEVFYTPPPAPKYDPANDPQPHYTILVESNPPGVRIEFNDAFVGTTPCRIRVPGGAGRKFAYGQMLDHVFKALPPPSGGSTQIKDFPKGGEIPERLFFDMRLVYR